MNKSEKLKYCAGCKDDFYNSQNPYAIDECWHLKSARLVLKKEVHVDQIPPWTQKPRKFLNCYRRKRYVYVEPTFLDRKIAKSDMIREQKAKQKETYQELGKEPQKNRHNDNSESKKLSMVYSVWQKKRLLD